MSAEKDLLTTQQFAEQSGICASTVSKWIRSGKIKGEKIGKKWMISIDQLTSLVDPSQPEKNKAAVSKPDAAAVNGKMSDRFYTIPEFSAMTYLTEFGVEQWLKQGRLKGTRDNTGKWQVGAVNLETSDIQRLLRK